MMGLFSRPQSRKTPKSQAGLPASGAGASAHACDLRPLGHGSGNATLQAVGGNSADLSANAIKHSMSIVGVILAAGAHRRDYCRHLCIACDHPRVPAPASNLVPRPRLAYDFGARSYQISPPTGLISQERQFEVRGPPSKLHRAQCWLTRRCRANVYSASSNATIELT